MLPNILKLAIILVLAVISVPRWPPLFAQGASPTPAAKRDSAEAVKPMLPLALRGTIKHRAVVLYPLPRDRTVFGIGEEVEFWLDPPGREDAEAVIAWHVHGAGTVYPLIGPGTLLKFAVTREDGKLSVVAARRDFGTDTTKQKQAAADLGKWLRAQIASLPKRQAVPDGDDPPAPVEYPKELRDELSRLDAMRKGTGTDFARVDEVGRTLLQKYPGPKERGQIYYWLAHVHAQSGLVHPERVMEYTRKALEQPLEPLQVPRLYVYWGDAIQVSRVKDPAAERRKWSALVYLAGLREVLEYSLPAKAPELPAITRGLLRDPRGGINEEARRRNAEQWAARRRAEFQRDMVQHRNILVGQLAGLYQQGNVAPNELRQLAAGVLRNLWAEDRLMRALKGAPWNK
jgi:hypothetical protein